MLHFLYKKEYEKAAEDLRNLLKRKGKQHSAIYYASRVSSSYAHVDPKRLVKMVEQKELVKVTYNEEVKPDILPVSGAGQQGTDVLVKNYMRNTPGQSYKKFKEYIK